MRRGELVKGRMSEGESWQSCGFASLHPDGFASLHRQLAN